METILPSLFIERLQTIIPKEYWDPVLKTFTEQPMISIRVNVLKTDKEKVIYSLRKQNIRVKEVAWYHDALILSGVSKKELGETALVQNGFIFIQSLSSMLVPLILDPKPGDHILDMCAAPGSKATQIAAMMHNQGSLLALESVKERYFKLKSVISLLGADVIQAKLTDARRFSRGVNLFDRILVDAPCSSEGRFRTDDEKSFAYWSPQKIKEMAYKQKELLLSASRLLKSGGLLIYSTCTFAPEENEAVMDWFLQKTENNFRVMKPENFPILAYRPVEQWNNNTYDPQIKNCLRVLPHEAMEGFFIAKLMRMG